MFEKNYFSRLDRYVALEMPSPSTPCSPPQANSHREANSIASQLDRYKYDLARALPRLSRGGW